MAKTPRAWSDLDRQVMRIIRDARDNHSETYSLREMEAITGISKSRVSDLYLEKNGSPSLQEFTSLCLVFGLKPSEVLKKVEEDSQEEKERKANLSDEERMRIVTERANNDDYGLAASRGSYKNEHEGDWDNH